MALRNAAPTNKITVAAGVDLLPPPVVVGLPGKFAAWRPLQQEAIVAATDSDKRFVVQCAPTGFGKSPVYMAQAKLGGTRTLILTGTKGLQSQLVQDFDSMGLVDIRGKGNYKCVEAANFGYHPDMTVEEAPCNWGRRCDKREAGCLYFDQLRRAQSSDLVVTNYSKWMFFAGNEDEDNGIGEFDLLILDEAHNAPDELAGFLTIEVDEAEMRRVTKSNMMGVGTPIDEWKEWGQFHLKNVRAQLKVLVAQQKAEHSDKLAREIKEHKKAERQLAGIANMAGDWVADRQEKMIGQGMRAPKKVVWMFDPIWPQHYAERILFRGIRKVVLFSATVRPKTMSLLGVADDQYDFNEYPSSFPVARRPVWKVPTVKVGYRTSEGEMDVWINRIDQIIDARKDRKGIVHTTSFRLRNFLLQNSAHKSLLISNDSRNTRDTIENFKRSARSLVFISPSLTTGWDFPYTECEYQIVGKIMFPNTQSAIMKARTASDRDWGSYIAMQTLVQACGRGMRAADDQCETFIIDSNIDWFLAAYGRSYAPSWWTEAVKESRLVPPPLPKLPSITRWVDVEEG